MRHRHRDRARFLRHGGQWTHREYTVLGDVVNLAARLMIASSSAAGESSILSDAATHEAAKGGIRFGTAMSLTIKGKSAAVSVYPVLAEHEALELMTPPSCKASAWSDARASYSAWPTVWDGSTPSPAA